MQALILAGGEGTRLRPLTSTIPKPVVPLVDRPFIAYMLEWLRRHGVDDVILSCGFMADGVRGVLGDGPSARHPAALRRGAAAARHRRRAQVRRGAARRALLHAQRRRADRHRPDRPARAARAHRRPRDARARAGRGSVAPTGWSALREDCSVDEFVEKPGPEQIDTNLINAGAYILERDVLDVMAAGGHQHLDRARGLPGARRHGPVRLRGQRLLARHRHPRALPAGDLRHPRGQRQHRARAAAERGRHGAGRRRDGRRAARRAGAGRRRLRGRAPSAIVGGRVGARRAA